MVVLPLVPVTPISVIAFAGSPSERPTSRPSAAAPDGTMTCGTLRPGSSRSTTTAAAPRSIAVATNAWPSLRRPRTATNTSPRSTARESSRTAPTAIVAIADQARAGDAVDELAERQGHGDRTRSLPDFVQRGKSAPGAKRSRRSTRSGDRAGPGGGSCETTRPVPSTSTGGAARAIERLRDAEPGEVGDRRSAARRARTTAAARARTESESGACDGFFGTFAATRAAAVARRPARRDSADLHSRSSRTPARRPCCRSDRRPSGRRSSRRSRAADPPPARALRTTTGSASC